MRSRIPAAPDGAHFAPAVSLATARFRDNAAVAITEKTLWTHPLGDRPLQLSAAEPLKPRPSARQVRE